MSAMHSPSIYRGLDCPRNGRVFLSIGFLLNMSTMTILLKLLIWQLMLLTIFWAKGLHSQTCTPNADLFIGPSQVCIDYVNDPSFTSSVTNLGTIQTSETDFSNAISNTGYIPLLKNEGTIKTLSENWGFGIYNAGIIDSLINSKEITSLSASGAVSIWNDSGGTITTLNNLGMISAGDAGVGIFNEFDGEITTLNNLDTISAGDAGVGVINYGKIVTLNNSGTISAENQRGGSTTAGIINYGIIGRLNNSSVISAGDGGVGIKNVEEGEITTLINAGRITVGNSGYGIDNGDNSSITTLSNSGSITVGNTGRGIFNSNTSSIAILNNSGIITAGDGGWGIGNYDRANITTLTNTGMISVGANGFGINNYDDGIPGAGGTIATLNNLGAISAGAGGFGINNDFGTITNLNNAQGGNASSAVTTTLTYRGVLPTNYNIIINSTSHYGQLAVTSPVDPITNFGIYGTPFITSRTYSSVLTNNVTVINLQNIYDNMSLVLVANGDYWDLTFRGVSLMGTQQSLANTASVLQGTFTLQNTVMVNGFTYDCPVFDKQGICISAGGRNTTVQAQGINNTSGLLIASYRLNKNNSRIGAWVDQNLSVSGPGTVQLGNSTPMIGLFGVWSQRPDAVGAEVKISAAYGQKDTTITRQIVGLSEAGSGSSQLISQGAQVVAKYGFAVLPDVVVSPYAGVRYTQNNMGGYTEATSSAVTAPLTYSALNTNATTALAGAEARYRGIPKTTLFASAGVETDTNTSNGSYSATGITGLTPVNFNPNPVKTRPTATVGGYYDIFKNQHIGVTGIYRQEPFQAVSTTTVLATYTIGL